MANSCGADTVAQELFDKLIQDADFNVPDIDFNDPIFQIPDPTGEMYEKPSHLTNEDLTTRKIKGSGTFDALMESINTHMKAEYEAGRITGKEYAEVYMANTQAALGTASQYLLGKDQAYWQAILVQAQARIAEVEAVTARIGLKKAMLEYQQLKFLTKTAVVDYALKKMQLAIADVDYCIRLKEKDIADMNLRTGEYNLAELMPRQNQMLIEQIAGVTKANTLLDIQAITDGLKNDLLGIQIIGEGKRNLLIDEQIENSQLTNTGIGIDNQTKTFNLTEMLPTEKQMLQAQMETMETERDIKQFTLDFMLPLDMQKTEQEMLGMTADTAIKQYRLTNMLPLEGQMLEHQMLGVQADTAIKQYQLNTMLPLEGEMLGYQMEGVKADTEVKRFTMDFMMPKQLILLGEQAEAQRAQTLNTRSDGQTVAGQMGKQKDLYEQQITSYQRDAEVKAAKIFTDAWTVMKTIDEGLRPPTNFANASLNIILANIKANNNLN